MHGMLARVWRCAGDQGREKGRHAIIQRAFRHDGDGDIVIKINRIAAWRSHVVGPARRKIPANDLPRTLAEKCFPRHRRECRLDTTIVDAGGRHDTFCVGAPDDVETGFAIHGLVPHYHTIS